MKKAQKEKIVNELKQAFDKYDSFYMVNFVKMPVSQFVELRKQFRQHSYSLKVVKNRLGLRALKENFPKELRNYFQGPTAIAFAAEEPIGLARMIKDFSQRYKVLAVKGGMLEGQFFEGERFGEIASFTSRQELLAKLGYLMAFPLIKLARTWQAPLTSLGWLLSQLKTKNRVGGKNAQSPNKRG